VAPTDQSAGRILFIDDDADVLKAGTLLLRRHGFEVRTAAHPDAMWTALAEAPADVVLLDLNFRAGARSGEEGLDSLGRLLAADPDAVVVVVTGHSGVGIAVSAMRQGASDFVMKPWSNDRLVAVLQDAVALRRRRVATGRRPGPAVEGDAALMLGASPAAERLRARIARAAASEAGVLLVGEPGVGKSLAARMIHAGSARRAGPFVSLDLSTLAPGEQRSRLLGEDGDGGLIGQARSGALLLKSIGALDPQAWPALLGVLDAAEKPRFLLSATEAGEAARLPDRLRFALAGLEIGVPPLRSRRGDILILAEFFARRAAAPTGRTAKRFSPEAEESLVGASWPGNIRELAARIDQAVLMSEQEAYGLDDVQAAGATRADEAAASRPGDDLNLDRAERLWVETALKRRAFNISHAAQDLGITRAALYRRMEKYGL
jgi:DNA-binding NtrC family response regulator